MSRTRALEEERNAILFRIQESRDEYRKLLSGEMDGKGRSLRTGTRGSSRGASHASHRIVNGEVIDVPGQMALAPTRRLSSTQPALRWVRDHPFLCVGIAAAVMAIGPRRILRIGVRSTTALAGAVPALTRRNSKNAKVDKQLLLSGLATSVITSLASSLAGYLQHRRAR
jgi:hypothetical protein